MKIKFQKVWAWEYIKIPQPRNSPEPPEIIRSDFGEGIFLKFIECNDKITAIIELQYGEVINIPLRQFKFIDEWVEIGGYN